MNLKRRMRIEAKEQAARKTASDEPDIVALLDEATAERRPQALPTLHKE